MESDTKRRRRQHFVLVHGLCHGAWCWYKVATVLESAGHHVAVLDLSACGASAVRVEEYSRPLLDVVVDVPPGEQVVLVGHSFGGHSLAMQAHPEKVAVAVFVAAVMPVAGRPMSLFLEQHLEGNSATPDSFLDSTFEIVERGSENQWMSQRMDQLSPPEDSTLAKMPVRREQMFLKDEAMTGESVLTEGKYGAAGGRQDVAGGGPAAGGGGLLRPRRGGEGDRGSGSHAHVLQASRARQTDRGSS